MIAMVVGFIALATLAIAIAVLVSVSERISCDATRLTAATAPEWK